MFQGWKIVAVSILTQAVQAGLLIYSIGVLAVAFEKDFGGPRKDVMFAATCLSIATSLLSPLGGIAIDRFSAKRLMLGGITAFSLGFILLGRAQSLVHVWLVFGLVLPCGNLMLGQLPTATLMTRWFQATRGRAMGIAALGTSVGGFVFPVLLSTLFGSFGWRDAVTFVGVAVWLLIAPAIALVVVDRPEDIGTGPDGRTDGVRAATSMDPSLALAAILQTRPFWVETVVFGLGLFVYLGVLSNLVPHAMTRGLTNTGAAGLISLLTVFSVIGKLVLGSLSDRLDLRHTLWIAQGCMALGCALFASTSSPAGLLAGAAAFGFAAGGLLPVWGAMVAKSFGRASFGRALGAMNLAVLPITSMSGPFGGAVYDATGAYTLAFSICLGLLLIAAFSLRALRFDDAPSTSRSAA